MADRQIVSIVWHSLRRTIDVRYDNGDVDQVIGPEAIAVVLAKDAGLRLVPAPEGTRHWVRAAEAD